MVIMHIKLKGINTLQYPYTLSGVKRSKRLPSENGHVAYQIKGNDTYNNMQAIDVSRTILGPLLSY